MDRDSQIWTETHKKTDSNRGQTKSQINEGKQANIHRYKDREIQTEREKKGRGRDTDSEI